MTTFAAPGLEARVPDPSKHVNYTLGMVLGVDDFNQDFAYANGHLHWLARDAIGYGTLVGLRVGVEDAGAKGPRVTVTAGAALLPPGRLVCVKTAQCGYLNDWLAANKASIPALIGSPLHPTLPLYLTLCHRECPVDPVPIPGEPCRSESELMAPSRLVDDFLLELRTTPPDQREEDLVREFLAWMRMLAFGGGGPYSTVDQFVAALRSAVQDAAASPPGSPLSPLSSPGVHFVFGSPLLSLKLDPALAGDYFRAAFRIWVTEIRPKVHPGCCTCTGGCGCGEQGGAPAPDKCLLLARVDVPIVNIGGDEWRVDDTRTSTIDESRRPVVISLRVLQEWVVTGGAPGSAASAPAGPTIVAAGTAGAGGVAAPVLGNLAVSVAGPSLILVNFTGYGIPDGTFQYVVKAMALVAGGVANPTIAFDQPLAGGLQLRVTNGAAAIPAPTLSGMRFMVEVSRVPA
jgi:hypothetical protein